MKDDNDNDNDKSPLSLNEAATLRSASLNGSLLREAHRELEAIARERGFDNAAQMLSYYDMAPLESMQ